MAIYVVQYCNARRDRFDHAASGMDRKRVGGVVDRRKAGGHEQSLVGHLRRVSVLWSDRTLFGRPRSSRLAKKGRLHRRLQYDADRALRSALKRENAANHGESEKRR